MIGFQHLIRKRKINITNLAKEIRVNQSTIFDWFRKEKIPKKHLKIISEIFDVDEDYLIEKVNNIKTYKIQETGFNKYKICGEITIVYLQRRNGEIYEAYIDTKNLNRLIDLNYHWHVAWRKGTQTYYVRTTVYRGMLDGKANYDMYYLHRLLLDITDPNIIVDHENHDTLDTLEENLRITSKGKNDQHRSGANKNNKTTGVRNISYIKEENLYWVQFMKKGERFRWTFASDQFDEACEFAEKKRKELFGVYAGKG